MAAHQARYGRRGVLSARLPSSSTRLHSQLTRNSPCNQSIRKRLVVSTCVCAPVNGSQFLETLVRTDSCIAVVRVGVFMPCSLLDRSSKVTANKFTNLARSQK